MLEPRERDVDGVILRSDTLLGQNPEGKKKKKNASANYKPDIFSHIGTQNFVTVFLTTYTVLSCNED